MKFNRFAITATLLLLLASSVDAQKRRAVASPTPDTKQTSLSIVGPDEFGKYRVGFSAWFPVPQGTTMSFYTVHVNGDRNFITGSITVTADEADRGWAGWIWGPFTNGAPIPEDVVAFQVEFVRGLEIFSVSTKVPGATRSLVQVDVFPDGRLFIKGPFNTKPVVSLNGHGEEFVWGWVTPSAGYTGENVRVAVCWGFPHSECVTNLVDIPAGGTGTGGG